MEKTSVDLSGMFIPHPMQLFFRNTLASNAILVDTKHYDLKKSDSVLVSQDSYFGLDKNKNLGGWK